MKFDVRIHLKSPLHLGSGYADVNLDADIMHDAQGIPYFPAKRLKGSLYESATEVCEMFACCGKEIFRREALEEMFQRAPQSAVYLRLHDFYPADYEKLRAGWMYLQTKYKEILSPADVLAAYTSIRFQTRIDPETGAAQDASLRNIRVIDAGIAFCGTIEIVHATDEHARILALALKNFTNAGLMQTRGLGQISCEMDERLETLLESVWKEM